MIPSDMSNTASTNNKVLNRDSLVQQTYNAFNRDKTVLIPVIGGKPVNPQGWTATLQQSHKADYQKLLTEFDMAVVCGQGSVKLSAIQFKHEKQRQDCLAQNPALKDTLLTSFPDAFFVWLRIRGGYPGNYVHSTCEWIAEGPIVVASRDPRAGYKLDNQAHPVSIRFRDLVFHPEMSAHLNQEMALLLYPRDVPDKHGAAKLNDDFIVSLFMDNYDIWFNPVRDAFFREEDGGIQTVYDEEVKNLLHAILESVRRDNETIPGSEAERVINDAREGQGLSPLKAVAGQKCRVFVDTGLEHVAELVDLLKILAVWPIEFEETPQLDEAKAFDYFLQSQLETAPGASLTVEESRGAYERFCFSQRYPRYSERQFHGRFGKAVSQAFGIQQNHDTIRNGLSKRGFRNLRIKGDVEGNSETLRTDRTDRTAYIEDVPALQSA